MVVPMAETLDCNGRAQVTHGATVTHSDWVHNWSVFSELEFELSKASSYSTSLAYYAVTHDQRFDLDLMTIRARARGPTPSLPIMVLILECLKPG